MGSTEMPPQELTLPQNKDASTNVDITVIDLSSWTEASLSDKTSMAATWHQAFSTHGLVWLMGHGLGPLYQHVADQGSLILWSLWKVATRISLVDHSPGLPMVIQEEIL